jgi:hypothetical protein
MNFLNEILDPNIDSDIDTIDHLIEISHQFNHDFPDTHLSIYEMKGKDYLLVNVSDTVNADMQLPVEIIDELIRSKNFILLSGADDFPDELNNLATKCKGVFIQRLELPDRSRVLVLVSLSICGEDDAMIDVVNSELTDILVARMLQRYINRYVHRQSRTELSDALHEVKIIKEKLMPAADYKIEGLNYAKHYAPCIAGGGDHFDPSRVHSGAAILLMSPDMARLPQWKWP